MTCSICLDAIEADIAVHSTCCLAPVCSTCAAEWSANPNNDLRCQFCQLDMTLTTDSANHPTIQQSLSRQGRGLITSLTQCQAHLTAAMANFETNQSAWLTNVAELYRQLANLTTNPTEALTGVLEQFYQATAKDFSLHQADLSTKITTTSLRLQRLQAYLTQTNLPLTVMILAQEWVRLDIPRAVEYQPKVWYRHCQAVVATKSGLDLVATSHYSIQTAISSVTENSVNSIRVGPGWPTRYCFLDCYGHLRIYRPFCQDGGYSLELLDLTAALITGVTTGVATTVAIDRIWSAPASLILANQINYDLIYQTKLVAALPSGYLVFTIHRDSLSGFTFKASRKIIVCHCDHRGQLCWIKEIHSPGLVHIEVYGNQILVFGRELQVWRLLCNDHGDVIGLDYSGFLTLGLTPDLIYHHHWSDNNYIYFYGPSQPNRDNLFWRCDAANLPWNRVSPALVEVTLNQVVANPIAGLWLFRPLVLPGQTLFWAQSSNSSGRPEHEVRSSQYRLLLSSAVVPLPDLWGRIYTLVT